MTKETGSPARARIRAATCSPLARAARFFPDPGKTMVDQQFNGRQVRPVTARRELILPVPRGEPDDLFGITVGQLFDGERPAAQTRAGLCRKVVPGPIFKAIVTGGHRRCRTEELVEIWAKIAERSRITIKK